MKEEIKSLCDIITDTPGIEVDCGNYPNCKCEKGFENCTNLKGLINKVIEHFKTHPSQYLDVGCNIDLWLKDCLRKQIQWHKSHIEGLGVFGVNNRVLHYKGKLESFEEILSAIEVHEQGETIDTKKEYDELKDRSSETLAYYVIQNEKLRQENERLNERLNDLIDDAYNLGYDNSSFAHDSNLQEQYESPQSLQQFKAENNL